MQGDYVIRLQAYEVKHESDVLIAKDEIALTLAAGKKRQRVKIEIPGAEL